MPDRVFLPDPDGVPRLAHVASSAESASECGKKPWPARWRGLAGDGERQAAYMLTLCMGCVQAIKNGRRRR